MKNRERTQMTRVQARVALLMTIMLAITMIDIHVTNAKLCGPKKNKKNFRTKNKKQRNKNELNEKSH